MGTELVWAGKYDETGARRTVRLPSSLPEWGQTELWPGTDEPDGGPPNRLLSGDNLLALAALRHEFAGRIALIYLDPPFALGADFTYPLTLGEDRKPTLRALAYTDRWGTGPDSYLHQMWERFVLVRDLLSETGTLYVHCDWRMSAPLRLMLDEVFGAGAALSELTPGFRCEISWLYREAVNKRSCWNRKHDTLLMYTKSARWTFNADAVLSPLSESTVRKYRHVEEGTGRRYRLMGRGITGSPIRSARDIRPEWERTHPELTFRHYQKPGTLPLDYWYIDIVNQASPERVDYPTQKPEGLLERIVKASSNPGDWVLDPCCGSGTTPAVSERLGRNWLAVDASPWAIHTTRKRLLTLPDRRPFAVHAPGGSPAPGALTAAIENGILHLTGFAPDLSHLPETERAALAERATRSPLDFLDFWAVDFCPTPDAPFTPIWWSGRARKNRQLTTQVSLPEDAGTEISVRAVDAWGRESAVVAL